MDARSNVEGFAACWRYRIGRLDKTWQSRGQVLITAVRDIQLIVGADDRLKLKYCIGFWIACKFAIANEYNHGSSILGKYSATQLTINMFRLPELRNT
jgi:hypothetical protein